MRIIKNQPVIKKLSDTLSKNEVSDISMVVETPTILSDWYLIDPDYTTTVDGWDNIDRYVGPDSQAVYNFIAAVPLGGASDMSTTMEFDEDVGYDERFQSSCLVYPRTVMPLPGSFFTMRNGEKFALYQVTNVNHVTMRSNPFIEITFILSSRSEQKLEQLNRQVRKRYTCCLSTIGTSKSLILADDTLESLNDHVENYLDLLFLYKDLFYSDEKAAFVFDGLPDKDDRRACFIDMTLWRLLFDEGIVIYDDIVSYANSTSLRTIDPIFTACPDVMVEDNTYRRSILYKIYDKKTKGAFDEYRFPYIWNPTARITKYQGRDIWHLEGYQKHPGSDFTDFYIWDDEFLCRIRNNDPYPTKDDQGEDFEPNSDACAGCPHPCYGAPVGCFNPYLRNVIIKWLNDETIDFLNDIVVADIHSIENYYLIPLVMGIYKQFIRELQNSGTTL